MTQDLAFGILIFWPIFQNKHSHRIHALGDLDTFPFGIPEDTERLKEVTVKIDGNTGGKEQLSSTARIELVPTSVRLRQKPEYSFF